MKKGVVYSLNEVMNLHWLQQQDVRLRVENSKVQYNSFFVAMVIKQQCEYLKAHEQIKLLITLIDKLESRTVYRWNKGNYNLEDIYPSVYKRYSTDKGELSMEVFKIEVLNSTGESTGYAKATIAQLEALLLLPIPTAPILNVQKIVKTTDADLQAIIDRPALSHTATFEEKFIRMCEDFATGLITITTACERHGISYLEFVQTITKDSHYAKIYNDAIRIAGVLQSSRQLTIANEKLTELLQSGWHYTETLRYKKKMIAGQLEPVWIEDGKSVTRRQITPTEIIMINASLFRYLNASSLNEQGQANAMTDEELYEFLKKENPELTDLPPLDLPGEVVPEN